MFDAGEAIRKLTLNTVRFTGLRPIARRLVGGIGAILMLHRVTDGPGKPLGINRHLSITPGFLDAVITDMKSSGYQFVSMDEAVGRILSGQSGAQFATITADDAYRDNLTEALPVFEKHGTPFTIYVAPALINGDVDLWWDVLEDIVTARDRLYLPTPEGRISINCSSAIQKCAANAQIHNYMTEDLREEDQVAMIRDLARSVGVDHTAPRRETLMNWDEIRSIAAHPLGAIGAHTINHYNLRRLSEERAVREIVDAARILELELGSRPRHMAYPYGYLAAVGAFEVELATEAGYVSAVTTRHGVLKKEHAAHLRALPRISINGRYQQIAHIRTMLSGATTPLANSGKMVVTV